MREDEQEDFSLTQTSNYIAVWKKRWSQLPLYPKLFTVSSLKSPKSVQILLQFVETECTRIFDHYAIHIPSSYQEFLLELKEISKEIPLLPWSDLFNKFGLQLKMDEQGFKTMVHYLQSIGRVVWLPNGTVFTDPTIAPKIAAKFVSPKEVRMKLLKEETKEVQILDEFEIGCLLEIDTHNNNRYFLC